LLELLLAYLHEKLSRALVAQPGAMEQSTELALTNAWSAAWADFLVNKVAIAERRAAPWLAEWPLGSATDADALLMLADLAHISGAVREDEALLRQALVAYDAHLALMPTSQAGLRMRAETLLRLAEYRLAFCAFDGLHHTTLEDAEAQAAEEVAPFRLLHDAECIEAAVRQGADADALETAALATLTLTLTLETLTRVTLALALALTRVRTLALTRPQRGEPLQPSSPKLRPRQKVRRRMPGPNPNLTPTPTLALAQP
jgi:hypothetical protein